MVTVIGIGMKEGELTESAVQRIESAKRVFLRSCATAAGKALAKRFPHVVSLDDCFDLAENFDAWVKAAVDKIVAAERETGEALYLTDGDGYSDSCAAYLGKVAEVSYAGGVAPHYSSEPTQCELKITASDAVTRRPYLDTNAALHVTEIDDAYLAGELKLWLMEYYGDDCEITLYNSGAAKKIPLTELDRQKKYDYSGELYIAAAESFDKAKYSFGDLERIMRRLTAPDGCPWDKAQTHESVRVNMIEEAYEAVDAVNSGDLDAQIEEMGDVMLQSVLHGDIARRYGEYDISDVISALCRKLVYRHTHIFGDKAAADPDEALKNWEAAKADEKSYVSTADKLNRLPENFPALLAAQKVYNKLVKAGVKPSESVEETKERLHGLDEEKCGEKLFWIVAAMSEMGIDAEVALSAFVAKVKREFAQAEKAGAAAEFWRKK